MDKSPFTFILNQAKEANENAGGGFRFAEPKETFKAGVPTGVSTTSKKDNEQKGIIFTFKSPAVDTPQETNKDGIVTGVSTTSNKDNEQKTGFFTIGKIAADTPQEKNKDTTSKDRNKDRVVIGNLWTLNLLETPWRSVDWTSESREELMEMVESYKPAGGAVSEARVLLLGPCGAGKSSFISSVQSVFSGRVLNRAMVGSSASVSFTKKFQSFPIRRSGEQSAPTALVLCDIMGIGEGDSMGLSHYDALCVIKGHVMEGHQFSAEEPVRYDSMGFIKKPSLKDKIHCVVFVVDASKIDTYTKGLHTMFQKLRDNISSLGVHQVALLTHVDEVCTDTSGDIRQVYRSHKVQQLMVKAGALLGMATSYIVPVRNYSFQLELNDNMDILLLNAVDHILQYVDLYFQDAAADYKVAN